MRLPVLAAAFAAIPALAFAQGAQGTRPAAPAPAAQAAQPAVPSLFPCRTESEICYVGVALPNNQLNVLYTNHDKADAIAEKPMSVTGTNGSPLDLSGQTGRVVMLIGEWDGKTGLGKAEIIDTASPLLSFAVKALLAGDDAGQDDPEPQPPAKPQAQPQKGGSAPAQQQPPKR